MVVSACAVLGRLAPYAHGEVYTADDEHGVACIFLFQRLKDCRLFVSNSSSVSAFDIKLARETSCGSPVASVQSRSCFTATSQQ